MYVYVYLYAYICIYVYSMSPAEEIWKGFCSQECILNVWNLNWDLEWRFSGLGEDDSILFLKTISNMEVAAYSVWCCLPKWVANWMMPDESWQ